jgi:hypothetical protein
LHPTTAALLLAWSCLSMAGSSQFKGCPRVFVGAAADF